MTEHERQQLRAQETLAWVKTWRTWREDYDEDIALAAVRRELERDPHLSDLEALTHDNRFSLGCIAIEAARAAHPDGEAIAAEQVAAARAAKLERRQRILRAVRDAFVALGKDDVSLVNLVAYLDRHDPSWGPRSEAMNSRCATLAYVLRWFGIHPCVRYSAGRRLHSRYVSRSEVEAALTIKRAHTESPA
jgi:hypothetical protein